MTTVTMRRIVFLPALLAASLVEMPAAAQQPALKPAAKRLDAFGDPLPDGVLARIGTVRFRHAGGFHALRFSPDGRLLLASGEGGMVGFYKAATGKLLRNCGEPGHQAQAVAFAPDGQTAASASWHGDISLWKVATGRLVRKLGDNMRWDTGVVHFTADGKRLVTCNRDGQVGLWDAATGKETRSFRIPAHSWFTPSVSADGALITGAGDDHVVSVWEVASGKRLFKLPPHKNREYTAVFAPDGRYLATGGRSNNLHLWELATGQLVYTLPTQDDLVAFSPDGRTLASAGGYGYGSITLWDLATGKERIKRQGHETPVTALTFSPDGRTLASASAGGVIRLWDTATGKEKVALPGFEGGPAPVRFLPDGRTLVLQTPTRMLYWDLGAPRADSKALSAPVVRLARPTQATGVLSPDGKLLAIGASHRGVSVYDIAERTDVLLLPARGEVSGVAFAPDGKAIATAAYGAITVWDAGTGKALRQLEGRMGRGHLSLGYTPDGRTLVAAGFDAVSFWDTATGKERRTSLSFEPEASKSGYDAPLLRMSPSGRTLALVDPSQGLALWDIASGRSIQTLSASTVYAFSPDGRVLAVGRAGSSIDLWEVATGKRFAVLSGHEGTLTGVAFTPDGRTLASGSTDNTVLLWDVRPGHVLHRGKPVQPRAALDLPGCWKALAEADAKVAQQAVGRLALDPARSIPFLSKRLTPVAVVSAKHLRKLIDALDAREFAVREQAVGELKGLGYFVAPGLRQALQGNPPLEARRRLESLLAGLHSPEVRLTPGERLRFVRSLQVLEAAGTPEARAVLERLAQGAGEAIETQDARAALRRLQSRSEGPPAK